MVASKSTHGEWEEPSDREHSDRVIIVTNKVTEHSETCRTTEHSDRVISVTKKVTEHSETCRITEPRVE